MNIHKAGLPRPQLIVVHDFGVTASDVTLDGAIGARLLQMIRETPTSEQELDGRAAFMEPHRLLCLMSRYEAAGRR